MAHLKALTGLRFVAAAMIVIFHARVVVPSIPQYSLSQGVSFFFVLSGFILAYAYPKISTGAQLREFVIARIARIWPAHLCALVFTAAFLTPPAVPTLLADIVLVQGWVPSWPWYFSGNSPSWSISTEMFFYLAFPALIFDWRRSWWWKWLLSGLLVVGMVALGSALNLPDSSPTDTPTLHGLLYINPLARLFEFVTGMATCLAFRVPRARSRLNLARFTALEVLVVSIAGYAIATNCVAAGLLSIVPHVAAQWVVQSANAGIFALVILVFAAGQGLLSRALASRPFIVLGEMSFSVYLLHYTIFVIYRTRISNDLVSDDWPGFAICIAVTLVLSGALWLGVERPARYVIKQWNSRSLQRA